MRRSNTTCFKNTSKGTQLGRLHPYPAMVPDDLTSNIISKHIKKGDKILDPFCGTGRLLIAAASNHGIQIGLDINPLACLISKAKFAFIDVLKFQKLVQDFIANHQSIPKNTIRFKEKRRVDWYSQKSIDELSQIIFWINKQNLSTAEKIVMASALSAAARDTSYCRKSGWKLHRLNEADRDAQTTTAIKKFIDRLTYYIDETTHAAPLKGQVEIRHQNAAHIFEDRIFADQEGTFDVVVTSPPYGDSTSTVQYGAASALCLDIISNIQGLQDEFQQGHAIDAMCLGGRLCNVAAEDYALDIKSFWQGSKSNPQYNNVMKFLVDYRKTCQDMARLIKPGGKAIFVVGRRSTGGFRLKLDKFTAYCFEDFGFSLEGIEKRALKEKHLPRIINRFGRSGSIEMRSKGKTITMQDEYVVILNKQ